jgi:hypothetical protein
MTDVTFLTEIPQVRLWVNTLAGMASWSVGHLAGARAPSALAPALDGWCADFDLASAPEMPIFPANPRIVMRSK